MRNFSTLQSCTTCTPECRCCRFSSHKGPGLYLLCEGLVVASKHSKLIFRAQFYSSTSALACFNLELRITIAPTQTLGGWPTSSYQPHNQKHCPRSSCWQSIVDASNGRGLTVTQEGNEFTFCLYENLICFASTPNSFATNIFNIFQHMLKGL